jgi:hypothetical protein
MTRRIYSLLVAMLVGAAYAHGPICVGDEPKQLEPSRAEQRFLESETAALAFAETHHPELASLLVQLKENANDEYKKAIAELDRSRDRLDKLRDKQPDKYGAALKEWQLSSRIKLTLARMALSKDPTLEPELRAMVQERAELRLQPLRAEQERIKARLEKVSTTLDEYDRDPAAAVEKEVAALLKGNRDIRPKSTVRPKAVRRASDKDSTATSTSAALSTASTVAK